MKLSNVLGISTLVVPFLILSPHSVKAHSLEIDGHVGAVIHTEPNDAPIAGTSTPIYLTFKNDTQPFDLSAYALTVSVDGQEDHLKHVIPETVLQEPKRDALLFSYTFLKTGTYDVIITGTPRASATAPAFTLTFDDVSVQTAVAATTASTSTTTPSTASSYTPLSFLQIHSLHAVIVGVGILIGTVITVRDERKRRRMAVSQ